MPRVLGAYLNVRFFSRLALGVVAAIVSHAAAPARAQILVAVGVGTIDQWDTEFELANPFGFPLDFQIGADPNFQHSCPGPCNFNYFVLPPFGSIRLRQADIFPESGLYTSFVLPGISGTGALPTLKARVIRANAPCQAVEVPVLNASTVRDLSTAVSLAFPAVTRTATAHTNLIIDNFSPAEPLAVNIDLYDPAGERLARMQKDIAGIVFLKDIVAQLGVPLLERGQIVITRRDGGAGMPSGFAATVDSIQGVVISVGLNP